MLTFQWLRRSSSWVIESTPPMNSGNDSNWVHWLYARAIGTSTSTDLITLATRNLRYRIAVIRAERGAALIKRYPAAGADQPAGRGDVIRAPAACRDARPRATATRRAARRPCRAPAQGRP